MLMKIEKVTAHCAHKIVCISKSIKELGVKENIFQEEKTIHVGKGSSNGIDLSLFDPENILDDEKQCIKNQYDLNGYFVFGFVGRLVDRKGISELYTAFDRFYNVNKAIKLMMVGKPY